jgi:hypothetical protein
MQGSDPSGKEYGDGEIGAYDTCPVYCRICCLCARDGDGGGGKRKKTSEAAPGLSEEYARYRGGLTKASFWKDVSLLFPMTVCKSTASEIR